MQQYVLDRIDDDRLRTYVVWGPMLGDEVRGDAVEATVFQPDPRATHLWTAGHEVAERFRRPAGLEEERAWDTFLLYPPGVRWQGEVPPEPATVMHVGKSLPKEDRLHGERLYERVRQLLDRPDRSGGDGRDGDGPDH